MSLLWVGGRGLKLQCILVNPVYRMGSLYLPAPAIVIAYICTLAFVTTNLLLYVSCHSSTPPCVTNNNRASSPPPVSLLASGEANR